MSRVTAVVCLTSGSGAGGGKSPEDQMVEQVNEFLRDHPDENWQIVTSSDVGSYAQRHLFMWLQRFED